MTQDAQQQIAPVEASPIKPHLNAAALEWVGRARAWLERAKAAQPIASVDEHALAVAHRKQLGISARQLEDSRKAHGAPYRAALDSIQAFFRGPSEDLEKAMEIEGKRIQAFEDAERARRRAEEERLRQEKAAEARRLREEAERLAREKAEAEQRALEEAQALEAAGRVDEADDLLGDVAAEAAQLEITRAELETAAEVVELAPVVAAPELFSGGLSRRVNYSARVVDLRALVQAWLDGKVQADCILPNEKFLNAMARAQRTGFAYPGCELVADKRIGG